MSIASAERHLQEFDAGTGPLAAPDDSPRGERPASTSPNNEGDRRNPIPGSAAVASQEHCNHVL